MQRDMKIANVLLYPVRGGLRAKLGDLGIGRFVDGSGYANTNVGSKSCMAPELLFKADHKTPPYTSAVDVWGLGDVILSLLIKQHCSCVS